MAALPVNPVSIITAIDEAIVGVLDVRPRPYLGISQLGRECDRYLWYSFRWASIGYPITGQSLRRSRHEDAERRRLVEWLELAGVTVETVDASGSPFRFIEFAGHVQGVLDGVVLGIPEAPKTHHLLILDALPGRQFNEVEKHGLFKSRVRKFYESQVLMGLAGLDRALYLAVNSNDDRLYSERIKFDKDAAALMYQRAVHIVEESPEPPPKLSEEADWFQCRGCEFTSICHGVESTLIEPDEGAEDVKEFHHPLADVNCRTCLHATPQMDGVARWTCAKWDCDIPEEGQREGCAEHRYIPALVHYAVPVDADMNANTVTYELNDGGRQFVNGGEGGYTSDELRTVAPELIGDEVVETLRDKFGAKVVSQEKAFVDSLGSDEYDEDVPL